jgi:metal-sulfur cluster biosynthetic enzyme
MSKITPTPREKRNEPHWKVLNQVIDPELGIGLVDLGLIYNVDLQKDGLANVTMTLTSPACPVGPMLVHQVEDALLTRVQGVNKVNVQIVWEPTWNQEMIHPDLREMMFGL